MGLQLVILKAVGCIRDRTGENATSAARVQRARHRVPSTPADGLEHGGYATTGRPRREPDRGTHGAVRARDVGLGPVVTGALDPGRALVNGVAGGRKPYAVRDQGLSRFLPKAPGQVVGTPLIHPPVRRCYPGNNVRECFAPPPQVQKRVNGGRLPHYEPSELTRKHTDNPRDGMHISPRVSWPASVSAA